MNNVIPLRHGQAAPTGDLVNHPAHYNSHPSGVECIDIIENLPCNPANVVKYSWRTGARKATDADPKAHPINKARWYKEREKVRRVTAMNQALQQFQQTGDAGGLVGQIGSLISTVDLLLEAIIVMGSTKHDLAVAAGLIQDTPPDQLGAPEGNATHRAWQQEARQTFLKSNEDPSVVEEEKRSPSFDHCYTGDERGEKGACGTPGPKSDADLLDTPNSDDLVTELPDAASPTAGYAEDAPNPVVPAVPEDAFALVWNQVARGVHSNACQKGFWDKRQRLTEAVNSSCGAGSAESDHVHDLIASQCFALIHSEISEALEGLRAGNPYEHGLENVRSVEAELADAVIRIMDTAAAFRWDVGGAILKKVQFNAARPRMHGGKRF